MKEDELIGLIDRIQVVMLTVHSMELLLEHGKYIVRNQINLLKKLINLSFHIQKKSEHVSPVMDVVESDVEGVTVKDIDEFVFKEMVKRIQEENDA